MHMKPCDESASVTPTHHGNWAPTHLAQQWLHSGGRNSSFSIRAAFSVSRAVTSDGELLQESNATASLDCQTGLHEATRLQAESIKS